MGHHLGFLCRERKWKLNMAKKYVRAVARSNLDLESRSIVKQRDAELAVRRKAAFIGKEVGATCHALPHAAGSPRSL